MDIKEIQNDLGDKKDFEVFAKSSGGKKFIADLRKSIASNIFKIPSIRVADSDTFLEIIAKIKSEIRVYRMFITASNEVDSLTEILKEFEEE